MVRISGKTWRENGKGTCKTGNAEYTEIEAAPGRYVKVRAN
jgi:poly(3-hydroxyalkanoate) synthetase